MAASMRFCVENNSILKVLSKFKFNSFSKEIIKNRHLLLHTKRNFSTKRLNSFDICVDTVRKYDYENYLCSLLLPEPARSASFVIRAFNAEVSQVRDLVSTTIIGEMRMQFWKNALNKTFSGNPPEQPVTLELAKILRNIKLSKSWFLRLINSRESLLNDKPFLSIEDLENYCDESVTPVYVLILEALGVSDLQCDHVASHIGKTQGICNFLRGVPFNISKGRLYLPLEIMSKHKLSQEAILHGEMNNLHDAVFDLSTVAHQHLILARKLSKDVPKHAMSVFLPAVSCGRYLENLEKTNFDVFHPKNQIRNNLLPILLWSYKLRKKF